MDQINDESSAQMGEVPQDYEGIEPTSWAVGYEEGEEVVPGVEVEIVEPEYAGGEEYPEEYAEEYPEEYAEEYPEEYPEEYAEEEPAIEESQDAVPNTKRNNEPATTYIPALNPEKQSKRDQSELDEMLINYEEEGYEEGEEGYELEEEEK